MHLDTLQISDCARATLVACVEGGFGFQQQYLDLFFCDGQVFDASRHDYELTWFETHIMATKLDHQAAAHHEKQFVFVRVLMPDKLALELSELDIRVVEFADNLRTPEVVEESELLAQIHLVHKYRLSLPARPRGSSSADFEFCAEAVCYQFGD